jgi:undecaprenyl-diphosphatase
VLRWTREVASTAVVTGAFGLFLAIGRTARRARANAIDRTILRSAGRFRAPLTTKIAIALTTLGGLPAIGGIAIVAVLRARSTPRVAAQIALGALGGIFAEFGLKQAFGRARPAQLTHLERVTSKSYPSGHSVASSSLYLTLAFISARTRPRGPLVVGAFALSSMVGLTRIYLGVHYPTDVAGGLALGSAWASAIEALFAPPSDNKNTAPAEYSDEDDS